MWLHIALTTSSHSSEDSSSRLLNSRGCSAGGSEGGPEGDAGELTVTTETVLVLFFFAAFCFARGPGIVKEATCSAAPSKSASRFSSCIQCLATTMGIPPFLDPVTPSQRPAQILHQTSISSGSPSSPPTDRLLCRKDRSGHWLQRGLGHL